MKKLSDLVKPITSQTKEGKIAQKKRNERGELLEYFAFKLPAPYTVKLTAIKLSHLTLSEMYALKSQVEDRIRRGENYVAHITKHMAWNEKKK
jgi:hypothetical protein